MTDDKPHNVEDDAKGAKQGGEAHRGVPEAAPGRLGRKDPTVSGDSESEDNVPIR